MKIAVTSSGQTLEAALDPRFGRCACFIIVETDDMSFEALVNGNISVGGGAGILSAQLVANNGATVVLTGNCGPNAHKTLTAAGINVIVGCSGTVSEAVDEFKAGKLKAADAPNVDEHSGMGNRP